MPGSNLVPAHRIKQLLKVAVIDIPEALDEFDHYLRDHITKGIQAH